VPAPSRPPSGDLSAGSRGATQWFVPARSGRPTSRSPNAGLGIARAAIRLSVICRSEHGAYVVAMLSPKHRLSRCRTIDIKQLTDHPLLLLHRTFGLRQWLDSACNAAHVSPPVVLESASPQSAVALARQDLGIAIAPSTVVPTKCICVVPLVQRGRSIGVWMTVAGDRQRTLATYAQHFVEELIAHCKRSYPNCHLVRRTPAPGRPPD
jgi:LysR family transcriptional regulator, cyn operon transcriptional activator